MYMYIYIYIYMYIYIYTYIYIYIGTPEMGTPGSGPLEQTRCTSALWRHTEGARPSEKSAQAPIACSGPLHSRPARTIGTRSVLLSSSSSCSRVQESHRPNSRHRSCESCKV